MRWKSAAWVFAVVFASAAAACTVWLNRDGAQCRTDGDCAHFGSHPLCRDSVCVPSSLCPAECFLGAPSANSDFLNQCSLNCLPPAADAGGQCLAFDSCGRAGVCTAVDAGVDDGGEPVTSPPVPEAGVVAASDGGTNPLDLPDCRDSSSGRGSVVFLSGSSNFVALLKKMAPIITEKTGLVPVFRITDSCTGASSMYPSFVDTAHKIRDPALGSTGTYAQYYDATGAHDCLLGPNGADVDVGESEIFAATCGLKEDTQNVSHQPGPILPILFVVPKNSLESVISASAARLVLGNGGMAPNAPDGKVTPWTDPSKFYIRGGGTATTRLIGQAIGLPVPPNRFWGIDQGSAQKLAANLALVIDYNTAEQTIGILGSDSYDTDRFNLKALAFQANEQTCAYLPDSSLFTKDKLNVRDGHYPIWGTLHFYIAVSNAAPVSPQAQAFVTQFSMQPLSKDLLDAFIESSWVPQCAMKVQRVGEMSEFRTDHPPAYPCGCYFDAKVTGKVPPGCQQCEGPDQCTDPAKPSCNYGYCEAQP